MPPTTPWDRISIDHPDHDTRESPEDPTPYDVPNVPGVDVLVDSRYGARGHGRHWREEHEPAAVAADAGLRNRRAALLRIQGPLKRAWEYPTYLDMFQADPRGYLDSEIDRMPDGSNLPGDHENEHIVAALAETEGGAHPSIESYLDASVWNRGSAEDRRHACATQLLDALRETSHMLFPLTSNECK